MEGYINNFNKEARVIYGRKPPPFHFSPLPLLSFYPSALLPSHSSSTFVNPNKWPTASPNRKTDADAEPNLYDKAPDRVCFKRKTAKEYNI